VTTEADGSDDGLLMGSMQNNSMIFIGIAAVILIIVCCGMCCLLLTYFYRRRHESKPKGKKRNKLSKVTSISSCTDHVDNIMMTPTSIPQNLSHDDDENVLTPRLHSDIIGINEDEFIVDGDDEVTPRLDTAGSPTKGYDDDDDSIDDVVNEDYMEGDVDKEAEDVMNADIDATDRGLEGQKMCNLETIQ